MIGTVFGAWLGAVPIPLDWYVDMFSATLQDGREVKWLREAMLTCYRDREWQKWPVTIVTGAYIGFAVGKLVGGTVLKGKKIMFD